MVKILYTLSVITIFIVSSTLTSAQPHGIYVLDNSQGTYRDANIRNYAFVDGYVWRTSWAEVETSQGVYDFSGVDHIVKRLDSINKKLTILFGGNATEPAYIAGKPGVSTYTFTDPVSSVSTTRAVPYESFLLERYRLLLAALANHTIYNLSTGTMVALKDHPVLANISTNIPGLGAIRNVNGQNTKINTILPGYSRAKFIDSIVLCMKLQTDNFPNKNVFIPSYKNIDDNTASPTLSSAIKTRLLTTFNGVQNPKIGFWQENLAGFKDSTTQVFTGLPTTAFATPLYQLNDSGYAMFQMLQGWTTPFLDPTKTAHSSPFDAMCYAYNTYGASYFEIYVGDIDHAAYQTIFTTWDTTTCKEPAAITPIAEHSIQVGIYPNPAAKYVTIYGLKEPLNSVISISDKMGKTLITTYHNTIDISNLVQGSYIVTVTGKGEQCHFKLMKL